ncbi:MAG: AAA family ATPase [Actinomycetota bacterium]|nr:AAA family ATPase [Actinomycetota bacterium]
MTATGPDLRVMQGGKVDREPPAPQDLEAEEKVLGAVMLAGGMGEEPSRKIVQRVRDTGLTPADFYMHKHGSIFAAILAADDEGKPAEASVIANLLEGRGELELVGGKAKLGELWNLATAAGNAGHFAQIVTSAARRRMQREVGKALARAAENGGIETNPQLREALRGILEGGPRAGAVEPLDLTDLLAGPLPETEWRWDGWLARGDLGILAGDPGIGKSILTLLLSDAVRRGGSFLGEPCERGRVGLFDYENPMSEALKRIRRAGVTADDHEGLFLFHCPPLDLGSAIGVSAFAETVERFDLDLIVIDSLRRAAPGLDENDSAAVSSVLSPLRSLTASSGRTIIVVHHSRKRIGDNPSEAGQMVRGSLDLVASVDVLLYIRSKESGTFTVECAKSRRGLPHEPIQVRIAGDGDDAELRLVNEGPVAYADDKVEATLAKILTALRDDGGALQRQVLALKVGTDTKNNTFSRALNLGYDRQQLAKPERQSRTEPQLYALAPELRDDHL